MNSRKALTQSPQQLYDPLHELRNYDLQCTVQVTHLHSLHIYTFRDLSLFNYNTFTDIFLTYCFSGEIKKEHIFTEWQWITATAGIKGCMFK